MVSSQVYRSICAIRLLIRAKTHDNTLIFHTRQCHDDPRALDRTVIAAAIRIDIHLSITNVVGFEFQSCHPIPHVCWQGHGLDGSVHGSRFSHVWSHLSSWQSTPRYSSAAYQHTIICACERVVGVAIKSLQLGLQLKYSFIKPFYTVHILQIDSDSSGILKLCNRTVEEWACPERAARGSISMRVIVVSKAGRSRTGHWRGRWRSIGRG